MSFTVEVDRVNKVLDFFEPHFGGALPMAMVAMLMVGEEDFEALRSGNIENEDKITQFFRDAGVEIDKK